MKIFVLGHPKFYGGAGTELHHQIILWRKHMNLDVHIIPFNDDIENEELHLEMLGLGVVYENILCYNNITNIDIVISYCNRVFLTELPKIVKHTNHTIFVNCMTWIFDEEFQAHNDNLIQVSLYQRMGILLDHKKQLNSKCHFMEFIPFFDNTKFKFIPPKENLVNVGRISRYDIDKFSRDTFTIWSNISSTPNKGVVLGFKESLLNKIGQIPDWVETYTDHTELDVIDFYKECDIIIQSTDTRKSTKDSI